VTCGAPIDAINTVRKHVSAVKGGRLAVTAGRATKITLAVSDVPVGKESALASGPTLPDPTTVADVHRVMEEFSLREKLPATWRPDDFSESIRNGAEKIASFIAGKFGALLKNLVSFFVDLFIVIFSLFFMFRDGEEIVRGTRHLLPFDESIQDDMWKESKELIFASVAVGLIVALVQGFLGGVAFAVGGIPTPIFWGVIIGFFSLVPVVGSALIWVPAALWLGFSGHWGKALAVVLICGGVAGIADNIIRPVLLRNRTHLNELLLFISVLGGIEVFGLLGLIVGPTVVAAAMA